MMRYSRAGTLTSMFSKRCHEFVSDHLAEDPRTLLPVGGNLGVAEHVQDVDHGTLEGIYDEKYGEDFLIKYLVKRFFDNLGVAEDSIQDVQNDRS